MPNKYQREIEEILRNMDRTDTQTSVTDRVRSFNRPRRRASGSWRLPLGRTETLLLVGVALILIAAGLTYYRNDDQLYLVGDWLSLNGILALAGFLSILLGFALDWRDRFRGITPRPATDRAWRSPTADESDNVVDIGGRRGPLTSVATRVRLIRLKLRYLRSRGHD